MKHPGNTKIQNLRTENQNLYQNQQQQPPRQKKPIPQKNTAEHNGVLPRGWDVSANNLSHVEKNLRKNEFIPNSVVSKDSPYKNRKNEIPMNTTGNESTHTNPPINFNAADWEFFNDPTDINVEDLMLSMDIADLSV